MPSALEADAKYPSLRSAHAHARSSEIDVQS
jgi:hypothetical protein